MNAFINKINFFKLSLHFVILSCFSFYANSAQKNVALDNIYNYVLSSSMYQEAGLEYGYVRYDGETGDGLYDGHGYFIEQLWKSNKNAFPGKGLVPIAVSDITIFVDYPGEYPIAYASPYVERGIIKFQLEQLLNRSWIFGYSSPDVQTKALYDNALEFAMVHNLALGQTLSQDKIDLITKDMVWLESYSINGQAMLVPIVYLSTSTIQDDTVDGNTIAFGSADLNFETVSIDGTKVITKRDLFITAKNVSLTNSIVKAGSLELEVGSNIELLSTQISANQVTLTAEKITNKTLVTRFNFDYDNSVVYTNALGDEVTVKEFGYGYHDTFSQLGFIESFGDITITAQEDFVNQGANLNAQGVITIEAGDSIAIVAQPVENYTYHENEYWSDERESIDQLQSQLSATDITLLANNSILLEATSLEAEGTIQLLAGMGIHLVDSVNSISSEESFEFSSGGIFGSSESESETVQQTELLRTVLNAGENIVVRSVMGNIIMRATKFDSEGSVSVVSDTGSLSLEIGTSVDFYNYEYYTEDLMVFHTKGYGHQIETGHYNEINAQGGLVLNAETGIHIEYIGEGDVDLTIGQLAESPELKWMMDYANDDNVKWNEVKVVFEEWDYDQAGLTEAGAIIVAIAVSSIMPGADAFLLPALGNNAIVAAALQAGAVSLATQAGSSLIVNGGDPLATLQDLGSNLDVKSLAIAMATAGTMDYIGNQEWFANLHLNDTASAADAANGIAETESTLRGMASQAAQGVYNAAVDVSLQTVVTTVANGGSLSDMDDMFLEAMAMRGVNAIGEHFANEIHEASTTSLGGGLTYVAHAALGCALGEAIESVQGGDDGCSSGAAGGVVSHFVSEQQVEDLSQELNSWKTDFEASGGTPPTQAEVNAKFLDLKSQGVDVAKLTAGMTAMLMGGNVSIAVETGRNAAENNGWFLVPWIIRGAIFVSNVVAVADALEEIQSLTAAIQSGDEEEAIRIARRMGVNLATDIVLERGIGALGSEAAKILKAKYGDTELYETVINAADYLDEKILGNKIDEIDANYLGDTRYLDEVVDSTRRNISSDNAFDLIDEFRGHKTSMEPLGDYIPTKGDGTGTVAFIDLDGKPVFGVNSSVLVNDADKNLGRKWRDELGLNQGEAQMTFHAEAHSLMRAYEKTGGNMPTEVTIYVDRLSCGTCQNYLPELTESMGINQLDLHFKDGRTASIIDGMFEGNWQ